jgi:glutamate-1-semialdehyde aminotransferase
MAMTRDVERALALFPGGISNGEFGLPPERLIVIERGEGCRLWATRGREFFDFSMGWGTCLVGHARPEVVVAVRDQVGRGSNFAHLPTVARSRRRRRRCLPRLPGRCARGHAGGQRVVMTVRA